MLILYQQGQLGLILDPWHLIDFARSKMSGLIERTVIYSGTLGTLNCGFIFGERFSATLVDHELGRGLDLSYEIVPMQYLSVE